MIVINFFFFYYRRAAELLLLAVPVHQNQVEQHMNLFKLDNSFFFTLYFIYVCVLITRLLFFFLNNIQSIKL